jgi:hypothetical protein
MVITLDGIDLPSDLIWSDEYGYTPVQQSKSLAVDGTLIVEAAAALKGRTITLQGGQDYGWIDRATLELVRAKQYDPGLVMTLILNGISYSVLFEQPDGLQASPIVDYAVPDDADYYSITLKFFEV